MTGSFSDRFQPERYAGDEPVRLTADGRTWDMPERLFARAQDLARAYDLHLLPTLEIYEKTQVNGQQAGVLAEELEFIRDLALALACSRAALPTSLVIEGP